MREIGAETANALVTNSPLTTEELDALRQHFAGLHRSLSISGPRFTNALRDASDMHNRTVRRIKGLREEAARRAALAEDDELLEIM